MTLKIYVGKLKVSGVEYDVVMKSVFKDKQGNTEDYSIIDLLRDKSKVKEINDIGGGLYYDVIPNFGVCMKTEKNIVNLGSVPLQFSHFVIDNNNNEMYEKIKQVLESKPQLGVGIDLMEGISKNLNEYVSLMPKKKIRTDILPGAFRDMKVMAQISSFNGQVQDNTPAIKKNTNTSIIQRKPTDEVYYRLENSMEVLSDAYEGYTVIDAEGDVVVTDGGVPILEYQGIEFPSIATHSFEYKEEVDGKVRPLEGLNIIGWADSKRLMGYSFPNEEVTGYSENNELDIQENEEKFFNSLKELVKRGLKTQYSRKNNFGNIIQEITDEEVEKLIEEGKRSDLVDGYLKDFCHLALRNGRSHTGRVSETTVSEDDDEGEESTGIDVESKYYGYGKPSKSGDKLIINPVYLTDKEINSLSSKDAMMGLNNYIKSCNNSYAWAEALIKLLRWGSRKVKMLYVTGSEQNGVKRYLNLETFTITTFSGDWSTLKPTMFDEVSDRAMTEILYVNQVVRDIKYVTSQDYISKGLDMKNVNVIVGFKFAKTYEGDVRQDIYMDVLTFIDYIKNAEDGEKIYGFDYDGSKIIVEESFESMSNGELPVRLATDALKTILGSSDSSIIIEPNVAIVEKLIEQDVNNNVRTFNMFNIWDKFLTSSDLSTDLGKGVYGDKEELVNKIVNSEVMSEEEAVLWQLVGEYGNFPLKVNKGQQDKYGITVGMNLTVSQLIELYEDASKEEDTVTPDLTGLKDRLSGIKVGVSTETVPDGVSDDIMIFEESVKAKEKVVTPIVNGEGSKDEVVGYLSVRDGMRYVYSLDEVEFEKSSKYLGTTNFNKMVLDVYENKRSLFDKNYVLCSEETLDKIKSKMN